MNKKKGGHPSVLANERRCDDVIDWRHEWRRVSITVAVAIAIDVIAYEFVDDQTLVSGHRSPSIILYAVWCVCGVLT